MSPPTTAEALAGLSGPRAAALWSALVDRHAADAWRLIASRLADPHAAEDAYQEFWLRLPAAAARFRAQGPDPERAARAWLMHLAYATAIDHHRRRPRPAQPLEEAMLAAPDPAPPEPEQRAALAARVRAALDDLPEAHRRPLLLHLVAGLSYPELAADLRCPVEHARVKVHRALARLRAALGPAGRALDEGGIAGLLLPVGLAMPAPPATPPAAGTAPGAGAALAALPVAGAGLAALALALALVLAGGVAAVLLLGEAEPPAAAGTSVADWAADIGDLIPNGNGVHAVIAAVPAPPGRDGGTVLSLGWPSPHGRWVDVHHRVRTPLTALGPTGATVVCAVWAQAFAGVRHLSIRFADAQDESFEWRAPLPRPDQSGWRTVEFRIQPGEANGGWGDRPDARIELPLSFNGFAVELDDDAPAGAVLIGRIDLIPSP